MITKADRTRMAIEERRARAYCVAVWSIADFFTKGNAFRIAHGPPRDALLRDMHHDFLRDELVMTYVHPDWPPVEAGTELPRYVIGIERLSTKD